MPHNLLINDLIDEYNVGGISSGNLTWNIPANVWQADRWIEPLEGELLVGADIVPSNVYALPGFNLIGNLNYIVEEPRPEVVEPNFWQSYSGDRWYRNGVVNPGSMKFNDFIQPVNNPPARITDEEIAEFEQYISDLEDDPMEIT